MPIRADQDISVRLIGRIKKLLALSNSPNEHEAAAAAAKAQDLLFRHSLRVADIDMLTERDAQAGVAGGPIRERIFGETEDRAAHWQLRLATAVAKTSLCVPISQRFRRMGADGRFIPRERFVFVGRPNDIELAKLTLDFLSETLLHLAAAYVETEIERLSRRRGYDEERRVARGRAMRKAYLDGAAAAVAIRLTALFAERRDAGPDSVALVVRRETEIEDYLAHRHQGLGQSGELPSRPLRHEANRPLAGGTQNAAEAYDSGFSDGQGINLTPPHERLGEGDKITPQP